MLCATCGQDNTLGNSRCMQCGASLLPETQIATPKESKAVPAMVNRVLYSWVGFFAGFGAIQLVAPYVFDPPNSDGINLVRVFFAGLFGAGGMYAGRKYAEWVAK